MGRLKYSVQVFVNNSYARLEFGVAGGYVNPEFRIYIHGTVPPDFEPMVANSAPVNFNRVYGSYDIDYRHQGLTEVKIGVFDCTHGVFCAGTFRKSVFFDSLVDKIRVSGDNSLSVQYEATLDGGGAWKLSSVFYPFQGYYSEWTNADIDSAGYLTSVPDVRVRRTSDNCESSIGTVLYIGPDAAITPTPPVNGTNFRLPNPQSFRFVPDVLKDECNILQNFDNTLFCQMKIFAGFPKNFFQKVLQCDVRRIQWWSDFGDYEVTLRKYKTDVLQKTFDWEMMQKLQGLTTNFGIFLTNSGGTDPANTTRVYFNSGEIEIPINLGDSMDIINNPDGLNGSYIITAIKSDSATQTPYLLISLVYTAPGPSSPGTAQFVKSIVNFDIYESDIDFSDVPLGTYYLRVRAINPDDTFVQWFSEPITVAATLPMCNFLTWRNADNAFGVVWTTGLTCAIRIESHLYQSQTGADDENYRESNGAPHKISSKPQRQFSFEVFEQPFYRQELIRVAFSCDFTSVNKVQYFSEEGIGKPTWSPRYPLANASLTIEQSLWFEDYNGDDLGLIDISTGFVLQKPQGGRVLR